MLGLHLSATGPHTLHEQRSLPSYVGFSPCRSPAAAACPRRATERFSASQLQSPVRQLDWSLAAVGAGNFRTADRASSASHQYWDGAHDAVEASVRRIWRLQVLVQLRKLYRNLLRAEQLLASPAPVYTNLAARGVKRKQPLTDEQEEEEQERMEAAVELVAEMQLTAEQLKSGLRALISGHSGFGAVFGPGSEKEMEERIVGRCRDRSGRLADRAARELRSLPFSTRSQAQAALDARNARYRLVGPGKLAALQQQSSSGSDDEEEGKDKRLRERLERAERLVGKFVAQTIQPAVQRARSTPLKGWVGFAKDGASYTRGLWERLNGADAAEAVGKTSLNELPHATSTREARQVTANRLSVEVEELEKKLQEMSKVRESRLRGAGIPNRARMASELRDMDNEVSALSRALAVRTLQLEMEFIYGCLEDEAMDITQGTNAAAFMLFRQGSSDEVALLVAEFELLDGQLANLCMAVDSQEAILINEDDLESVATEIPDMRSRLGIGDTTVFVRTGFSLLRLQLAVNQNAAKVGEGVRFFTRGLRLLGSDVANGGQLFYRAALGTTLKPREVAAIRRTVVDVLTFVPFAIILIAPITPVGHVLVFSFLQRYFPGFFPTQFTTRRQELMTRYEELKKQLLEAQSQAEAEDEEAELARAAAAVARLTAPAAPSEGAAKDAFWSAQRVRSRLFGRQKAGSGKNIKLSKLKEGSNEELEGPAARALFNLRKQVAAAQEETVAALPDDSR
ncbi:hypothetical protein WJX74_000565 [Apatococcus lobatus]|uniref:Letm1 RBD domain-containing protein n=1 Tax=Apatococcus lobatus TaxID=904363 RepID=A0AAW1QII5_9CHLO